MIEGLGKKRLKCSTVWLTTTRIDPFLSLKTLRRHCPRRLILASLYTAHRADPRCDTSLHAIEMPICLEDSRKNMKNFFILTAVIVLAACGERNVQVKTLAPASPPTPALATVVAAPPQSTAVTLDAKALMKCAAETNTVNRLSCFDDFAKANNLAPSSRDTTTSAGSKWRTSTDKDPLTDKSVHYAILNADEGRGRFGDQISLIIRCKSGKTDAYINWNTFLGSDGLSVTSRIDKTSASTSYWSISTDHKASFMPAPAATLKRFEGASSFVVNLTPYSESPITAIFDVTGANDAFKDIRRDCKW